MTRDEIRARRDETAAFFDAAMKIAAIVEALCSGACAEHDADVITRRVCELVSSSNGVDSETGDAITGPVP